MMEWIQRWWRSRQRAMDMSVLWPVCKEEAPSLDVARAIFMSHCMNDSAWTLDYTEEDLKEFIGQLN